MIHVGDPRRYDRLAPVDKLLTLVFALVGRDRAAWLRFDHYPEPPAVQLWYCVDGVPYEMVPPPAELWPELVRILWRNARLAPPDRRPWWRRWRQIDFPDRPVFGVLPVRYGDTVVEFDALFFRGRAGEHVCVERPRLADVTAVSADLLRRRLYRPGESQ